MSVFTRMNFSKIALLCAAFLTVIISPVLSNIASAEMKIAIVDLQRAMMETEDGRKAKNKLKKEIEKTRKKINEQQSELKGILEGLEKQRSVLSEDAFRKKFQEANMTAEQYRRQWMESEKEIASREAKLLEPILQKMQNILKEIGQNEGYGIILHAPSVAWAIPTVDVTPLVILEYNKLKKKKK